MEDVIMTKLATGEVSVTNELAIQFVSDEKTASWKVKNPKSTMPDGAVENFTALVLSDTSIFAIDGIYPIKEVHLSKIETTRTGIS